MKRKVKLFASMREKKNFEVNSLIVLVLTTLASILGVVFQALAGRLLDTALFADLNAAMALFNILVLPTTAASSLIAKYTAELRSQKQYGKIKCFLLNATKILGVSAFLLSIIMFAFNKSISQWLHIEDSFAVILAMILAAITLLSSVFTGGLQGTEAFVFYGIFGLIGPGFKIVAVVVSETFTRKVSGILVIWIIGSLVSYLLGFFLLRIILKGHKTEQWDIRFKEVAQYLVKIIAANIGLILLSNVDMLLVKHIFNEEAGLYSGARMLAMSITYLANSFVIVIFPMVADKSKTETENLRLLKKSLWYNIILSIVAVMLLIIFADICIKILLGNDYLQCKQYLLPIAIYILPISILTLLANYRIARNNTRFITNSLLTGGLLEIVIFFMIEGTLIERIMYMAFVMWSLVGLNIVHIFHKKKN